LGLRIILQGIMFGVLTLLAFWLGMTYTPAGVDPLAAGQTMAFMTLSLSQVLQSFNMRSDKSIFAIGPFTNKKLNLAVLASLLLVLLLLFTPVGIAFGIVALSWQLYLVALGLVFVPTVIMELSKLFGLIKSKH
ncbi:MAG: cation transporting ATPase C-terminal domain-containing protein, partial [Ruminococcus sp.]|nr:cation transporting ATPase C-terminal domain-containing protein [Ruminococcus sp.]